MAISFSVGSDELRIMGHSISWYLDGEYERTPAPRLDQQQVNILSMLHNELCDLNRRCLADAQPILIEVGEPNSVEEGRLRIPTADFWLMKDAVASFYGELSCSPIELEVITGAAPTKTSELLSRLEGVCHQLGSTDELQSDHPVQAS